MTTLDRFWGKGKHPRQKKLVPRSPAADNMTCLADPLLARSVKNTHIPVELANDAGSPHDLSERGLAPSDPDHMVDGRQ